MTTETIRQAVRKAISPPYDRGDAHDQIRGLLAYAVQGLGPDLGLRLLATITQREGTEGLQWVAERYAAGMLYLDVELWAPREGAPVEGLMAGVGLMYGPPGSRVMDFHVVRTAALTAPRAPRPTLMRLLTNVGIFCDRRRVWCYGGSRWGVFAHIAARHPELGFTRLEKTYAHADGATYSFFIRPPC